MEESKQRIISFLNSHSPSTDEEREFYIREILAYYSLPGTSSSDINVWHTCLEWPVTLIDRLVEAYREGIYSIMQLEDLIYHDDYYEWYDLNKKFKNYIDNNIRKS